MDEQRVEGIFNKVYELTFSGKLDWRSPNPKHNTFVTEVGIYVIYLERSGLTYAFTVKRSGETINLGVLSGGLFGRSEQFNEKLEKLYEKVNRAVFKIDQGLDDLLKSLDNI